MQIIPAIDLINQQSVRLYQGDFKQSTLINESPLKQAQAIEKAGFKYLHLVDLDGAKTGMPTNFKVIAEICKQTSLLVEVGGGIRSLKQINDYLMIGVNRVILGSAAISNPTLVVDAIEQFGADQIVIGVDGKKGQVAVSGWEEESQVKMPELIQSMLSLGAKTFIVTDIERDGTLSGPNLELMNQLSQQFPSIKLISSGGVSKQSDLIDLGQQKIDGVIVGKAMNTEQLSLDKLREVKTNAS